MKRPKKRPKPMPLHSENDVSKELSRQDKHARCMELLRAFAYAQPNELSREEIAMLIEGGVLD